MAGNWELDIRAGGADGRVTFRVLVKGVTEAGGVEVIPACRSVDELKAEIARMKGDLDGFLEMAQRKIRAFESGGLEAGPVDPAQAWKKMEALAGDQDMFDYFNDLNTADRERIADYVLTMVSMFKGRGPVFSEHYDASTHLLG
ncbi:MAG: hypothetical protein AB9873_02815 [Syntrophobacteraceae bacterium]